MTPSTNRKRILCAALIGFSTSGAVAAGPVVLDPGSIHLVAQQSYTDVLVALENTGYTVVQMKPTFLGRLRILAKNREHLREVIVSRSTGEVKRDMIIKVFATGERGSQTKQTFAHVPAGRDGSSDSGSSSGLSAGTSVGGVNAGVKASRSGVSVSVGSVGIDVGG